jgi:alkanesulfonate monooxygenase SsuD/methylene tetrahydromethanopterin reductase-like flavin-dependent oxidoreductase (luciferase family)
MKFDIVISSVGAHITEVIAAAKAAEAAGFDAVYTYDHISGAVMNGWQTLDVWTALAAIAMHTDRVTIGPLVLNATVREPAHIHVAICTLQQLAGDRVVLGLGAGAGLESPYSRELTMFGMRADDAPTRRERVAETVQLLRALWKGETKYQGNQLSMTDVEAVIAPLQPPKIVVGCNGPKMAALAGTFADGVNLHSWERDLPSLISIARASANDAARNLEVSVEAPIDVEWKDASSPERTMLADLRVDRLQFRWNATMNVSAISNLAQRLLQD